MHAVVTAGGTREPIDDVRVVTNLSTGRFGAACALALLERGCRVTLLASAPLARHGDWLDPRIDVVPFRSFADLRDALQHALRTPPDLLLMAAAVSDYAPIPATGKLRSTSSALTIEMTKNPKLLASLREQCGPETTLVGFKLLSGVSTEELVDTARRQVVDQHLDLCFANDLSEITGGQHPAWLVGKHRDAIRLRGRKPAVAAALAEAVIARHLAEQDLDLHAMVGPEGRVHEASTTDPFVSAVMAAHPALSVVLEIPKALVIPTVSAPWDVAEVRGALAQVAMRKRWHGGGFSLLGPAHQVLVGLTSSGAAAAAHRYGQLLAEARSFAGDALPLHTTPVFEGPRPIGVTFTTEATDSRPRGTALWLDPAVRGHGLGDDLAMQLSDAGRAAWVPGGCDATGWLEERGFRLTHTAGSQGTWFTPPSERSQLRLAASVCLLDPLRRRVLIGRRLTPPWLDCWSFPGGSQEEGDDTLLDTALRELEEETGIRVATATALAHRRIVVGVDPSYEVNNFLVGILTEPQPQPSDEMDARWVDVDDLHTLRPMAAGTRRVIRAVMTELADHGSHSIVSKRAQSDSDAPESNQDSID